MSSVLMLDCIDQFICSGKFINTVQFAGQADPSVETLSDDAGLEHPPSVGLDVFFAYLLRVYMETMVDMHQSQSQKTVL